MIYGSALPGVMTLPHAQSATLATALAVRRDESAEIAQRVAAAREMDAAYARAKVLMDNLSAVRRRPQREAIVLHGRQQLCRLA